MIRLAESMDVVSAALALAVSSRSRAIFATTSPCSTLSLSSRACCSRLRRSSKSWAPCMSEE